MTGQRKGEGVESKGLERGGEGGWQGGLQTRSRVTELGVLEGADGRNLGAFPFRYLPPWGNRTPGPQRG